MPVSQAQPSRAYNQAVENFGVSVEHAHIFRSNEDALNAAVICCDRHADDESRIALRHWSISGEVADYTFAQLMDYSAKFALVLRALGVSKGDHVAGLLPRTPELLVTVLAAWRLGAVYQPLFTAFGPKAIDYRLNEARTRVVVTDGANRNKLDPVTTQATVVTTDPASPQNFWNLIHQAVGTIEPQPCCLDDPFLIMFTSGTTGAAKPLHVPIRAIAAFAGYMRDAVGLEAGDRFWNMADPGWAYGLYYAVTGPLAMGHATTFYEPGFTVEGTYDAIAALDINVLAGSPTAFRLLMGAGPEAAIEAKERLKSVSSAGEPLNPEIVRWFDEHLGVPIFDHYGQTELGMVLCNHHGLDHPVRIGSAGYASPGHRVVVLSDGGEELGVGQPGILALDQRRSPLMWFTGYLGRETSAFAGDYYLSGDTVERNDDGSISFVGRADDVITTSGYRVGPFDVESALIEHPAVLDTAVIGKPDPERTEIIKAFVILQAGFVGDDTLCAQLKAHVKARLSAHAYPREIEFVSALPRTPSGKLQRFLLRNHEIAKMEC